MLLQPTWRNLHDPFETWAWRNGLGRRLAELEQQKFIERHPDPDLTRVVRLTERGHILAWGGRDPAGRWIRPWDRLWRMVIFDIPVGRDALRRQLLRFLRQSHFGYLQNSVWISPDPTCGVQAILGRSRVEADFFVVMEGSPAAGESDAEIVASAWDFTAINQRYDHYLSFAQKLPPAGPRLIEWARHERIAWKRALALDPLLPAPLLPDGYRGRVALERRKQILAQLFARGSG